MCNSDVAIRLAAPKDIKYLAALLRELFDLEGFASNEKKQIKGLEMLLASKKDFVLVVEIESEIIGMCTVQNLISTVEGSHVGLVEDVIIKKQHAGKGIGKKLFMEVEKQATKKGFSRLHLLAHKENTPALKFYEKLGWSKTEFAGLRKMLPT